MPLKQTTIVHSGEWTDVLDELIVEELLWHYDNFGTPTSIPHVSHDADEEAKYVKQMRKALKRVIDFYSVKPLDDNDE